jgi:hypothetical protein
MHVVMGALARRLGLATVAPLALVAGCGSSGKVGEVDLSWAQWPMPNGATDVAAGAPNPSAYAVSGDGVVTDEITGLMWQQSVSTTLLTWADALAACSTLTLAGYGDWRVPAEIEIISLVDGSAASGPTIDATAFPGTPEGYYWSSLPMADSPANAWLVDFITGSAYAAAVDGPQHVRCMRTARAAAPGRGYTVSGETVYDPRTKLTWQRSAPTTMYGSDDARGFCASADLATALGGAGWRLPTVKELATLVDYSVAPPGPTIDAAAFPNTPGAFFWSSSQLPGPLPGPGFVDFAHGHATNYADGPTSYVRCVR